MKIVILAQPEMERPDTLTIQKYHINGIINIFVYCKYYYIWGSASLYIAYVGFGFPVDYLKLELDLD